MAEALVDLDALDDILKEFQGAKGSEISILQRVQSVYGYLPKEALLAISERAGIPISQLMGIATFYAQFYLERRGRNLVRVCDGTACHVNGSMDYVDAIEKTYHVCAGQSSPDYKYALEVVYCVGACGLAPVVIVNDKVHGKITPGNLIKELAALE